MVQLAVVTGVPAREWASESAETIATALDVLRELNRKD